MRSDASCEEFRDFISNMDSEEVAFQGRKWTWSNNWKEEGFIQARLDRFLGFLVR